MGSWSYNPWEPEVLADPYPAYRRLRDESGCHHNDALGFYVLSRFQDVSAALRDHVRLSSADGVGLLVENDLTLVGQDPPAHTKARRLATHPFTRQGLAGHAETMSDEVERLITRAIASGTVDVVEQIADPFVTSTLGRVFGMPDPDARAWLAGSNLVFDRICARDEPFDLAASQVMLDVFTGIDAVVEARKISGQTGPGDIVDAVIARATPDADGWRLSRGPRALFVGSLIAPGLQTTRHMVSSGFALIGAFPDEWRRVREGEVDVELFVEEILRYEPPIQGFFRATREPVTVDGAEIPAGGRVLVLFASANRDERVFSNADRFRVDRTSAENVSFGAGIHYCLGAGLARMEASALFGALRERVAQVELIESGAVRSTQALLRGWARLPVTLHAD